jgi:hypothetical protein
MALQCNGAPLLDPPVAPVEVLLELLSYLPLIRKVACKVSQRSVVASRYALGLVSRAILGEIAEAFKETGGEFFLVFRFWKETERRFSHHLLFVSKNFRGYQIMKDIMSKESSAFDQGVPSFEYRKLRLRPGRPLL